MKTLITITLMAATLQLWATRKIEREPRTEPGFIAVFESFAQKPRLRVIYTTNAAQIEKMFTQATGATICLAEAMKAAPFFDFTNGSGYFYAQYGVLKHKRNGKTRFRELNRAERLEYIKQGA